MVPPIIWKKLRWLVGLAVITGALAIGGLQMLPEWRGSPPGPRLLLIASYTTGVLIVFGIIGYVYNKRVRRFKQRLLECGYLMCLTCGHSLQGLPPNGEHLRCPECGTMHHCSTVRETWMMWYPPQVVV